MKKKNKYIIIGVIVLVVLLFVLLTRKNEQEYNYTVVEKGEIRQEVNVVGRVEPVDKVDLSFQSSGKVEKINTKVGEKVEKGDILVVLDNKELKTKLFQAQSSLESAQLKLEQYEAALKNSQAKLEELKKGAKPEEIKLAETEVNNAKKSLTDAQINLENVEEKATVDLNNLYDDVEDILNDAYFYADDAINRQIDSLFSNDFSSNPELTFSTSNSQARIDSETGRVNIGRDINEIRDIIDNLDFKDDFQADEALKNFENKLTNIRNFLNRLNDALNSAIDLSETTLSSYKTSINTARANINTSISSINSQEQSILAQKITNQNNISSAETAVNNAENNLELAQDRLSLKESGATKEQLEAQESLVNQAKLNISLQESQINSSRAEIENILAQIEKTELTAPISGVVTEQNAKLGEIVSINSIIVSIISQENFEIKVNVPEIDISKVKIGSFADVTLDAYTNNDIFKAQVVSINPAEKMIEGLATYEVTLYFLQQDPRLKSGMTADVNIITEEKEGVLIIPYRSIIEKDNKEFVKVLKEQEGAKEIKETEIKSGLKGVSGQIEIISGLKEKEKVIIP